MTKTSSAVILITAVVSAYFVWPEGAPTIIPPAAARENVDHPVVGEKVDPATLHVVTTPGHYGLGPNLRNSRYGVTGGYLIRYDPDTHQIQSILRRQQIVRD